jgi:hypothetical protein
LFCHSCEPRYARTDSLIWSHDSCLDLLTTSCQGKSITQKVQIITWKFRLCDYLILFISALCLGSKTYGYQWPLWSILQTEYIAHRRQGERTYFHKHHHHPVMMSQSFLSFHKCPSCIYIYQSPVLYYISFLTSLLHIVLTFLNAHFFTSPFLNF